LIFFLYGNKKAPQERGNGDEDSVEV